MWTDFKLFTLLSYYYSFKMQCIDKYVQQYENNTIFCCLYFSHRLSS